MEIKQTGMSAGKTVYKVWDLCNQWFEAADILVFMDFVSNHYGNKLCNPGKQ